MENKKIVLFTSSSMALPLINYLFSNGMLSAVVLSENLSMDGNLVLQNIVQMKIPYFQFSSKDENINLEILKQVQSDLAFVFAFPHKLSSNILDHFKNNIFNIHPSPLPNYRGPQPLFWQIRNGERKTALSIHKIDKNFDTGDIVLQKEFSIDPKDTIGILMGMIAQLLFVTVQEFLESFNSKSLSASAQIGEISKAPDIKQEDFIIDWESMCSNDIVNLVNACNPIYGGAKTIWQSSYISILETTIVDMDNLGLKSGTIIHIGYPEGLIVATKDGSIRFDIVSVPDGIFSGLRFSKRFNLDAGERFS